jgi:hypothetical protein
VRSYQQKRIAEGVGPRTVNMEGQLLRSILKHHEQWKLDGRYEPLPESISELGRSLTPIAAPITPTSGPKLTDPHINYAKMPQAYGLYGEGPITDPKDLAAYKREGKERRTGAHRRGGAAALDEEQAGRRTSAPTPENSFVAPVI